LHASCRVSISLPLAPFQLNIETGMVVAVPNPSPFDGEVIESAIHVR
jgi:hypothetical protein